MTFNCEGNKVPVRGLGKASAQVFDGATVQAVLGYYQHLTLPL